VPLFAYVTIVFAAHVPWGSVLYNTRIPHPVLSLLVPICGIARASKCAFLQINEAAYLNSAAPRMIGGRSSLIWLFRSDLIATLGSQP
jgi:hypothetical protein